MKVLVSPPPLLSTLLEVLLEGMLPPGRRASRRRLVPVDRCRRLILVDRCRRLILVDRRPPLTVRPSATNATMNTRFSPRVRWRP